LSVSESTKGAPQPSYGDSVERVCERAKRSRSSSSSKDQSPGAGAGAGNALQVLQLAQLFWALFPLFNRFPPVGGDYARLLAESKMHTPLAAAVVAGHSACQLAKGYLVALPSELPRNFGYNPQHPPILYGHISISVSLILSCEKCDARVARK